jgi:hypothetical protein
LARVIAVPIMTKLINDALAVAYRLKNDRSFEAVYLFSLLGLTLTLAFYQLRAG